MADTFAKIGDIFFSGSGIRVVYSSMHLIMPTIVIAILILLGLVMLVQHIVKSVKNKKPLINLKGYRFFAPGFDPFVFFASIGVMILYFWIMPTLHFLVSSILALFVLNILYARPVQRVNGALAIQWKPVLISAAISVIGPVLIQVAFGTLFGLTLP
jgi:hypothetical protein